MTDIIPAQVDAVRAVAQPLIHEHNYDLLLDKLANARFVLLGEATHGTQEFYQVRANITRRLIEQHGFNGVVVEADWPYAYRVNCFVRGASSDTTPKQALGDFQRFPVWMWRNTVVVEFIGWLRAHNAQLPPAALRVGFYGMDLYSINASIDAVIRYLDQTDPEAARRARDRYDCFEQFGRDPQRYGYLTAFGRETCENDVVAQLLELQRRAAEQAQVDGRISSNDTFYAEQNARLVRDAERYYRAMFYGRDESWNLRDTHMADTVDALATHLGSNGQAARLVVWAHNSHLGDARATQMGRGGELNVGQLLRERHGDDVVNVGFTTYSGQVTAANEWDEPPQHKHIRPALPSSYEALFHAVSGHDVPLPSFWLDLRARGTHAEVLHTEQLERAIGVIYRPETERQSHYFHAQLSAQFDVVIHIDTTSAVEPLDD